MRKTWSGRLKNSGTSSPTCRSPPKIELRRSDSSFISWATFINPGDAGGNKFPIEPPDSFESGRRPQNLHALWDLGCGLFPSTTAHFRPLTPEHREEIEAIAKKIEHDRPWSRAIVGDTNPMDWAKESLNYAKTVVYGLQEGAVPTPAYLEKGESVSETRAADAGYRLAALLNSTLK
jgi:hypothetical protein